MNKVGICLATYNGERYILEQLNSLVNQSYTNFHCYIQDDGSNDGTVEIIVKFISERVAKSDFRFELVSTGLHQGVRDNFLSLLKFTSEDYIMFCDQDDVWLEKKIELSIKLINSMELKYGKETPLLGFTDLVVVDSKLNIIKNTVYDGTLNPYERDWKRLIRENNNFGNTQIFNRNLVNCITQLNGPLPQLSIHDNLLTSIASLMGKIEYLPEATILYRQHGRNTIGAPDDKGNFIHRILLFSKMVLTNDGRWGCKSVREFALVFSQLSSLPPNEKRIIDEIVNLNNKNKFYRMRFYKKHGFYHGIRLLWA